MEENDFEDEYVQGCQVCSKRYVWKYWDDEIFEYIEINSEEKCFNCLSK